MKTFAQIAAENRDTHEAPAVAILWLKQWLPEHASTIYPTPEDAMHHLLSDKGRKIKEAETALAIQRQANKDLIDIINKLTKERDQFSTLHTSATEALRKKEAELEALAKESKPRARIVNRPEEKIDHPAHYNAHPSGVECITVAEHFGFNLGNVIKYVWRCDLKADEIEDLKKALWYLQREIAKREKARP